MRDKEISDLIEKAKESLEAAKDLLRGGYPDFSASRSYYAMFYAAEAILLTKSLSFSKHSAVIAAFGREYAKTGIVPSHLHKYISDAFDVRQAGDYGPLGSVNKGKAKTIIKRAEEFIETVEEYSRKQGYLN